MTIQPIDLPSLLRAAVWPSLAIVIVIVLRRPAGDLITILGQRIHKFSFGKFSFELAQVTEMKTATLETEIRQLDAGLIPQSGSTALSQLLSELQRDRHDYIVLDLGSESSPRWLTSRLYLLALLITLIDRPMCMVFVETVGGVRKRFIGTAAPDRMRWALARRYGWFESASAAAYNLLGAYPASNFQFDAATGSLAEWNLTQLMQYFLANVRAPQPAPPNANTAADEWVPLNDGLSEHAKWLNGDRIERLLGSDLSTTRVTLLPNVNLSSLGDAVLRQQGRFVAVVDTDRCFHCLIDRMAALETLAGEVLRQKAAEEKISNLRSN